MYNSKMELLAPAGDDSSLRAAVQNGADAVYLGAGNFNARRNAGNFVGEALNEAVAYCHARGVKVHVTLNTLVRQDEFRTLEAEVEAVNLSGADAVIVQDFGVAMAVKHMAPGLSIHASTQMAVHNRQGVGFLRDAGFNRAVLARELTYGEIARCAGEGIEIETFVHGALCVACSGQCLMSSLAGGRSGNRGLCAQPCRLPWRLGEQKGYLLSTRDLCGIDQLTVLREAGVSSLKIEGRLKRAEYVAVTVSAYRRALDALYAGKQIDTEAERAQLAQMFNRGGFTPGYGPGLRESELMFPERPNHAGVKVGECHRDNEVVLSETVENRDALVLRGRKAEDIPVKLTGTAGERVRCTRAQHGDALYRLVSDAQLNRARQSFVGEQRHTSVTMHATLRRGFPARLSVSDGIHVGEASGEVVQAAAERPFDPARAESQLKKTGGTPYTVTKVTFDADDGAFCPASLLNGLRRSALSDLGTKRIVMHRSALPPKQLDCIRRERKKPLLMAQCSEVSVLKKTLEYGADVAVFEPRDVRPEVLEKIDLSMFSGSRQLALAIPAVLTDHSLDDLNAWVQRNRDFFSMTLLSNIGQFGLEWPGEQVGDYLLNIGNNASICQLADWGMNMYTPSVELNVGQIRDLGGQTNLIMWGQIPLMHLRHCPLRAAEGMKGYHADCRYCDGCDSSIRLDSQVLVDRKGMAFPLRRIVQSGTDGAGGCVIQVLNPAPMMPLRRLDRLPQTSGWRLLLREGEPVEAVIRIYRAALDGKDFREMPEWCVVEQMKTTTGHYFRGVT